MCITFHTVLHICIHICIHICNAFYENSRRTVIECPSMIIDWRLKQEVWKFPIEIFWNIGARNFEIIYFLFQNSLDYGKLNQKNQKDNVIFNLDFDLLCRTSTGWCSQGYPGGWFWNLLKWRLKINTKGRFKENTFLKFSQKCELIDSSGNFFFNEICVARTFFVKPYLDVVLEVLLVARFAFLSDKNCR